MGEEVGKEKESIGGGDGKILWFSKEMLPCKLLFFFFEMAGACGGSFMSLFYLESGLTVDRIGIANCTSAVLSLFIFPVWGVVVDSLKSNRVIFILVMGLLTTTLDFSKPWVVMFVSKYKYVPSWNSTNHNDTIHNGTVTRQLTNPDTLLYAVMINGLISSLFGCGMMAYGETAIVKTVFTRTKAYTYGEQKVFAPIGWAVGALIAGIAVDHFKSKHFSQYMITFFMSVPLSLAMLPLLYIITKQADWTYGTKQQKHSNQKILKQILVELKKVKNVVFLLSVMMSGLCLCVCGGFMTIFIDETMHPRKTMISAIGSLGTVSEVIIYPFTSKIIKLFGSQIRVITFGIAASALRLVLLSYCTQPWHVMFIQPLQSVGLSLGWTGMIEHTWAIFPKEVTTTSVGLLVSCHWVGPGILSGVAGGYLYKLFGGQALFRGVSILGGSWVVIMLIYFEWINGNAYADYGDEDKPNPGVSDVVGCGINQGIELDEAQEVDEVTISTKPIA